MSKIEQLKHIELGWKGCDKCKLSLTRTNVVFYRGNPDGDLLFIGEAPGRWEDEEGEPFVGECGKVLDKFISRSKLNDRVSIMNRIGCRPPNNRIPNRDEIRLCRERTESMIEIIDPKCILLLGITAARLAGITSIGPWRGRVVEVELRKTYNAVVTYHPSYYIRQGKPKDVRTKMLLDMKLAKFVANKNRRKS